MLKRIGLILFALYFGVCLYGHARAADVKISALPSASALGGTEPVPAVQAGVTVQTSPSAINTYVKANLGILPAANGGTNNGFTQFTGPATSTKTFTLPNASANVLTDNALVSVAQGGTGAGTLTGPIKGNGTSAFSAAASSDIIGLWSGTCNSTTVLLGSGACAGLPAAANPSASVGLTAVNGSATTYMRSDAAPALAQSITPTWTGVHTWSLVEPRLLFMETTAGANAGLWDWDFASTVAAFRTRTDVDNPGVNIIAVTRGTGTAISDIGFGNSTNNPTYHFLGTGATSFAGSVTSTAIQGNSINAVDPNPQVRWDENDQGTDLKWWFADVNGAVWTLRTVTDALATGKAAMTVTRGTTTSISAMTFGNASDNPSYGFLGTGTLTVGGNVQSTRVQVTGAVIPQNGIYSATSNHLSLASSAALRLDFDTTGNAQFKFPVADQSYSLQAPSTGFSITIANTSATLILNPAGTLATGTITMPPGPVDGEIIRVTSSQTVTALTVSANAGQTINGAPTTITALAGFSYIYNASGTAWYRLY